MLVKPSSPAPAPLWWIPFTPKKNYESKFAARYLVKKNIWFHKIPTKGLQICTASFKGGKQLAHLILLEPEFLTTLSRAKPLACHSLVHEGRKLMAVHSWVEETAEFIKPKSFWPHHLALLPPCKLQGPWNRAEDILEYYPGGLDYPSRRKDYTYNYTYTTGQKNSASQLFDFFRLYIGDLVP